MTQPRVIRLTQLADTLALSRATIWRRVKDDPSFPQPFRQGRCTCWLLSDVDAYLKNISSARGV